MNTKVELGYNRIARITDLAALAIILFPGNRSHQRVFLAIVIELKYADGQFLSSLDCVCDKYGMSRRVFELARAKMRRVGLVDHVSRFNQRHGYREGWVFSKRFQRSLVQLSELWQGFCAVGDERQAHKDRDLFRYL